MHSQCLYNFEITGVLTCEVLMNVSPSTLCFSNNYRAPHMPSSRVKLTQSPPSECVASLLWLSKFEFNTLKAFCRHLQNVLEKCCSNLYSILYRSPLLSYAETRSSTERYILHKFTGHTKPSMPGKYARANINFNPSIWRTFSVLTSPC
jgi:hypothetical protein